MSGNRRRIPKRPGRAGIPVPLTDWPDVAEHFGIRNHEGYVSAFTRHQYAGAKYKNGTRITKAVFEQGDAHPIGALGTVLGSIGAPGYGVAYFVEWDDHPRAPTMTVEEKLERRQ